jgi:hypothetical protein
MGYGKKVDANQAEIVQGLKSLRMSVCDLSGVGQGVPDLIVGYAGVNLLVEVKSNRNGLTFSQREWHDRWYGKIVVAYHLHDVLYAMADIVPDEHNRLWLQRKAAQYEADSNRRAKGKREVYNGFDAADYLDGEVQ